MNSPHASEPSDPAEPGPLQELSRSIELVRQFHAGDGAACNELLERYRPRLVRIVRVKLGALRRHLDEEDVVQEVLLIAATKLASFELRSHAGILHWLARIAENVIRQKRERHAAEKRDAGREVALQPGEGATGLALAASGLSPSQQASRAELEALVDAAVEVLEPPEYREVILQRDYYQEEWEEVRRALDRPTVAAVQELHRRAHQRLKERLRKHLDRS
jgi:RNA polymerase sigma factor (sigma-70 family)